MEGLGTLGRLGLEGLLLVMYPNYIFSGLLTAWRETERFYVEGFGFLFDNTSSVVLVFASSFPFFLCLLLFAVVVILIGLDCLLILFIGFVHFLHTSCLS